MKKKITALFLCVALAAIAIAGASLAYFTDTTDSKTNTFTMGQGVEISLNEKFDKNNAVLVPGSSTSNNIQKEVSITNDGDVDAYVFYTWMIPSALDDPGDASKNVVHVNCYGATWDSYYTNAKFAAKAAELGVESEDDTWDHTSAGTDGFIGTKTVDAIEYNVYVAMYHGVLAAGETTTPGMSQVYLDSKVDTDGTDYYLNGEKIDYDFSDGVNIIVTGYAIQADGFADYKAAYAAFTAQNPDPDLSSAGLVIPVKP